MGWILSKRERYDFERNLNCSKCGDEIDKHIYSLVKNDNSKCLTLCRTCAIKHAKQNNV